MKGKAMSGEEKRGSEMNKERRRQISVGCVDDLDRLVRKEIGVSFSNTFRVNDSFSTSHAVGNIDERQDISSVADIRLYASSRRRRCIHRRVQRHPKHLHLP